MHARGERRAPPSPSASDNPRPLRGPAIRHAAEEPMLASHSPDVFFGRPTALSGARRFIRLLGGTEGLPLRSAATGIEGAFRPPIAAWPRPPAEQAAGSGF